VDAVVLAGGRDDPLARSHGVLSKAWIPVLGKPLLAWVLEALKAGGVERVAVVGPAGQVTPEPDLWVKERGGMLENLEAGLEALSPDRVMVATADVPLLTPEAVGYLLKNAPEAALVYPIVPREAVEDRWPGMRRTYARLKEGTFTGGNLVILDPELFHRALPTAKKLVARRKNPLALAPLFGLGALFKLLLGRLSVAELERIAQRAFGVPMRALVVPYPEIGADVDKPEDLEFVARELEARHAKG